MPSAYFAVTALTKRGLVDHLRVDHKMAIDDAEIPVNSRSAIERWHQHRHEQAVANHEHRQS